MLTAYASSGDGNADVCSGHDAVTAEAVIVKFGPTGDRPNSLAMLLLECLRTGREPPSEALDKSTGCWERGETVVGDTDLERTGITGRSSRLRGGDVARGYICSKCKADPISIGPAAGFAVFIAESSRVD